MSDCCLIKKVATVEVYENKNEVRAYGFMAGDKNTPMMEVKFRHLWGEENLSKCKLRWIIVDDLGSLLVGEVPIEQDNTASIQLPNELFTGERRMKVQLTVASCDGSRILNLQQFTDLKVINNLATNEVVEPVYQMLINQVYDDTKKYLAELETSYKAKYGSLESVYAKSKASLEQYLINAENGGNAEFLQGYNPKNFNRVENTINELVNSASSKYKVGDVVEVLGYYTAGDGSHHKRKIESADDGSGVQLANGLWANIVHNGEVNVSWFGAKGDGGTDDSDVIQKAYSFTKHITFNPRKYYLRNGLIFNSSLDFNNACFVIDRNVNKGKIVFESPYQNETSDITLKEVNSGASVKTGYHFIKTDELFCYRNEDISDPVYKTDFFSVSANKTQNVTWDDYDVETTKVLSGAKINLIENLQIKNLHFEITLLNDGSEEYDWGIIQFSRLKNSVFENCNITLTNNEVLNNPVSIINLSYTDGFILKNFTCDPIFTKGRNIGTYVIGGSYNMNLVLENVVSYVDTVSTHWGSTGTNYLKNVKVLNSKLGRLDCHVGGKGSYLVESSDIYEVSLGGKVEITIKDSRIKRKILVRGDYAGYFEGDILIENSEVCSYNNFLFSLEPVLAESKYSLKLKKLTISNSTLKSVASVFYVPPNKKINLPQHVELKGNDKFVQIFSTSPMASDTPYMKVVSDKYADQWQTLGGSGILSGYTKGKNETLETFFDIVLENAKERVEACDRDYKNKKITINNCVVTTVINQSATDAEVVLNNCIISPLTRSTTQIFNSGTGKSILKFNDCTFLGAKNLDDNSYLQNSQYVNMLNPSSGYNMSISFKNCTIEKQFIENCKPYNYAIENYSTLINGDVSNLHKIRKTVAKFSHRLPDTTIDGLSLKNVYVSGDRSGNTTRLVLFGGVSIDATSETITLPVVLNSEFRPLYTHNVQLQLKECSVPAEINPDGTITLISNDAISSYKHIVFETSYLS